MLRERNRTGRVIGVAVAALMLLCCAASAPAKVKVDVEVGWENKFRAGKWSPLFITLQDSAPRQVILEVYSPTDRRYALNIKQSVAIGPQPVVVPIYAPLSYRLDETSVTVRDADSGRRLEHVVVNDFPVYSNQAGVETVAPQSLFVLISGNSSGERMLQAQLRAENLATSFVAANRLPLTPAGYEGIDLLLLNQPEISRLNAEQQEAIATWVRGGGLLVVVPGSSPVPPIGPLIDILPARLGEIRQFEIDAAAIKKAGLPARFAKQTGRDLVDAAEDARPVPLFGGAGPKGVRRWVGMGQVMVVPIEVSTLTFDDAKQATAFWRDTLKGMADIRVVDENNRSGGFYPYYGSTDDPRRAVAVRQTLDWIGDVPGAGSFGFSYVAVVLLAMMFIVGPVDWFVLKWTGRQPWTWVTITGWIGLVTLGSIYIGHVFKSGEVHYRTASVVDEVNGGRVAAYDVAGIYSPRTTRYDVEMTPHGWWRTASTVNIYGGGSNLLTEVPCHQDYRGNRPLPLLINVWNMRFLEGQQLGEEPAMLQVQLTRGPGDRQIAGTITSRAAFPLKDLLVRTRDGVAKLDGVLEPGATMRVDASIRTDKTLVATTQLSPQDQWQQYSQELPTTRPTPQTINGVSDLRAVRIDQQLADRDDVACVYASYEAPPAERVKLNDVENPRAAHVGVVRALVPLPKGP